jgi:hypothetical protein
MGNNPANTSKKVYSIDAEDASEIDTTELTRMLQDVTDDLSDAAIHDQLEIVREYLTTCALVSHTNDDAHVKDTALPAAADAVKNATGGTVHKKQVKKMYDHALDDVKDDDPDVSYAHDYTIQHTTNVQKIKNTDVNQDSKYIFTLETSEGKTKISVNNEWKSKKQWANILDNRVEDIVEIPTCDTSEYVSQMRQAVEYNKTVTRVKGERTRAVEMLLDRIAERDVVSDIQTAAMQDLIYTKTDDNDAIDTLYVPTKIVSAVAESHDLTPNALHYQMSADGLLTGKSKTLSNQGQSLRAWQLNAEHDQVEFRDVVQTDTDVYAGEVDQ